MTSFADTSNEKYHAEHIKINIIKSKIYISRVHSPVNKQVSANHAMKRAEKHLLHVGTRTFDIRRYS